MSITVAVPIAHCVIGARAERKRLLFNDFCYGCRSTEEKETAIHFLYQCPFIAWYRHRLFGSPTHVSLTELSSLDVKNIASFVKLSDSSSSVKWLRFKCADLGLINLLLPDLVR